MGFSFFMFLPFKSLGENEIFSEFSKIALANFQIWGILKLFPEVPVGLMIFTHSKNTGARVQAEGEFPPVW